MSSVIRDITIKGWLSRILCSLVATMLGFVLLTMRWGDGLTRYSYDFPFLLRSPAPVTEAVIVRLDDASHQMLDVRHEEPWPREIHAELIRTLTKQGARLIVFDIVFETEGTNADADKELARAIAESGNVILCGDLYYQDNPGLAPVEVIVQPYEAFRTNTVGWGTARMYEDGDFGIRLQVPPRDDVVTLAWAAAEAVGAPSAGNREDRRERWINYYGPRATVPGISYYAALNPEEEVPPSFFKDKIVFVGQHFEIDFAAILKDDYITPFSRQAALGGAMPGVEIQATMALNLLRDEWLTRFPRALELGLIILIGLGFGMGLHFIRPWMAVLAGVLGAVAVALAAWLLFRHNLVWFAWMIPMIQISVATAWATTYNSARMYVDRRLLYQSISTYISPGRVDQILNNEAVLKPGGKDQQVSILFSDIAGFSGISEKLDPEDLFKLLNQYYATALESVHEQEGTVIQLIGDAIYAVWNAPLEQPDHKERACRAALNLHKRLVKFNAATDEFPLHTRVGVHSGIATVGNLGSEKRFEYTCIGDSVNLSSRLESLNKHVGTDMLATRTVQRAVEDEIVTRLIGQFVFKGFGRPVEVYELLGNMAIEEPTRVWRETFGDGVKQYRAGDLARAKELFKQVIEQRKTSDIDTRYEETSADDDGPSLFYLSLIETRNGDPVPDDWNGDIVMTEK